ncbi:MAG: acyl-CoA synthetase (AMP-forming)/AMP-acid ligase II [Bermanella sp.]|jgi:acyl-CoA synthetase (AMP-forming)/AMP-acid ligase II
MTQAPLLKAKEQREQRFKEMADGAYRDGHWVKTTLADALKQAAAETPERVLLIDGDTRINCATLYEQAGSLARALLSRAPAGSVVSFMLPNWHEAAVIYLASTLAGMVANPILPSLRERELAFILSDADSRFLFLPAEFRKFDYLALADTLVPQLANPPIVVVLRGDAGQHIAYQSIIDAETPKLALPCLNPDDVRMIMYTSGTTGRAKGVLHTHNTLNALIRQVGEHWRISDGDCFLVPSPISHIGGSIYAFESPLLLGSRAVLMEHWQPEPAVELMNAEGCTHMAGATPFLEGLLEAAKQKNTGLESLKVFICGGAAVPPQLIRDASAYLPNASVTRVYGSTEVPVTTVGAPKADELDYAAETDGRPGIASVKFIEHSAAIMGEGEICARGPQMLLGYLHPEDDASSFDSEGYFHTGDLGREIKGPNANYIQVTGRAKDIIIRNGENISPKELEDLLLEHPNISDVAVVGRPHLKTGERVCAVVVPKQNIGPDVLELFNFLVEHGVAKFKAPEQVEHWNALPRNVAGKVLKHEIRNTLIAATEKP